jgi:hypothetical protein
MIRRLRISLLALLPAILAACGGDSSDPVGPGTTPQSFRGCATVPSIALGASVSGTLASTDCSLEDGSFVDYYELRLTSARTVAIQMTSSAFDAYLLLFDRASGDVVAEDDDTGGGFNARIQMNLAAGTYIIGANSFDAGETGTYQLSVN